jgi:hypothetical protein
MKNLVFKIGGGRLRSSLLSLAASIALAIGAVLSLSATSFADENGISFWLPGLFGSLAAVPQQPGWQLTVMNYYDSVSASGSVAASREITIGRFTPTVHVNLNVNLNAKVDVGLINPSYVFATPVFGGQLSLGVLGFVGTNDTSLNGSLTLASGPFAITRQGSISQTTTGIGDLSAPTIKAVSIGTWTGELRNSYRSNSWCELWAISMSRLVLTRVAFRSCAHSNPA